MILVNKFVKHWVIMNLERIREMRSRKAELRRISDDISDTIFFMSELNLVAFFSLLISMIVGVVMIYDGAYKPLMCIGITEAVILAATLGVKEYIKKDLPELIKEEKEAHDDFVDYKYGINRHKEMKKTKTLTDKEIQSYIDVKAISSIYNEMQEKKKEEKRKIEKKNNNKITRIVITQDMVDEINRLFEEDKKIEKNISQRRYVDQSVVDEINALFKDENEVKSKHKIEVENSGFVKKRGVRR